MKCQAIFLVCLVLSATRHALAERWEFGYDQPESELIANQRGEIKIFENIKYIELDVAKCTQVDYVRVLINNLISNPTASFDKHTNTVVITYKPWQISASTYDVVAKGQPKPGCVQPPPSVAPDQSFKHQSYLLNEESPLRLLIAAPPAQMPMSQEVESESGSVEANESVTETIYT